MASKDCHIGDKMNVHYDFPCPKCKGKAEGNFSKIGKVQNGSVSITAACVCGQTYDGEALFHQVGMDVEIHFPDVDIKDSDLNVYGY